MQINMIPYVKYLVLKIDMFQTEIIDEKNFDPEDEFTIGIFKKKYRDPKFTIVKVTM